MTNISRSLSPHVFIQSLVEYKFSLEKESMHLEQEVHFLKERRSVIFAGSSIALLVSLLLNGVCFLRHSNNTSLKLLLASNSGLNIAVFCYALKHCNQEIEEVEKLIEKINIQTVAIEEEINHYEIDHNDYRPFNGL